MVAIRVHFDGRALIPEEPVQLPRDRMLIVHVEPESAIPVEEPLRSVLTPSDTEWARRPIHDPDSALENF